MNTTHLSTESYKGVRDFYPADKAVQQYIFDTWSKTATSFGFEQYDASVLEPSTLYKNKGAENAEMVNEQTYTFIDRGEREVTLRPEMTPTVARMVAGKRHNLSYPVRWFSIPNLFRYERPQRGRLREHWQLNCDIFGASHFTADVEIIALAYQLFIDFGARPENFEIRINSRELMQAQITDKLRSPDLFPEYLRLMDRKAKISAEEFAAAEAVLLQDGAALDITINPELEQILSGANELGVTNIRFDPTITRGFNYYTGTVFEVFDVSGENNRSMLGGGRYDNLTEMFGGEPISGIGFGMGDVTMRDFLETHSLLPDSIKLTSAHVAVLPMSPAENLPAQGVAQKIRAAGFSVTTDISEKKIGKKIGAASDSGVKFICVLGENEVTSGTLTIKNLLTGEEHTGQLNELMNQLSN